MVLSSLLLTGYLVARLGARCILGGFTFWASVAGVAVLAVGSGEGLSGGIGCCGWLQRS